VPHRTSVGRSRQNGSFQRQSTKVSQGKQRKTGEMVTGLDIATFLPLLEEQGGEACLCIIVTPVLTPRQGKSPASPCLFGDEEGFQDSQGEEFAVWLVWL
jgi:hypothetical protein